MLSLVAVALFAQAPLEPLPASPSAPQGCAVALVRAEGMTAAEGEAVAERVRAALQQQGIPIPLSVSEVQTRSGGELKACTGKPECIAGAARTLGAGAAVTVDAATLFGELTVELALIDASSGRVLADKVFAGALESASVGAQLDDFGRTARYALMTLEAFQPAAPPAPPRSTDAPRVTALTPQVQPNTPREAFSAARPAPVAAWVVTGAAVASAATATAFGWMAHSTWRRGHPLSGNQVAGGVTAPQADAMFRDSVISASAGVLSAGLTTAAIYLFLNPPGPAAP